MTRLSPESWNSIWAPPTSGGKRSPRQLPFFDFSCLKSRSSIILLSTSLILLGIFSPFLLLILEPEVEREMGLAWVGRVCYSSLLTMSSVLPRHSRQYTCQTAGLGSSLALLFLTTTHHWVWLFGLRSQGLRPPKGESQELCPGLEPRADVLVSLCPHRSLHLLLPQSRPSHVCRLCNHGRRRMRRSFWWPGSASTTWRRGSDVRGDGGPDGDGGQLPHAG